MQKINSLTDLLCVLPKCEGEDYKRIAKNMHIPAKDILEFVTWNKSTYTRNCIARTQEYELILLCWEEGQETDIHCHGGEECWVYLAQGKLREKRFSFKEDLVKKNDFFMEKQGLSYMNDDLGYHSLQNVADGKSISLHLYVGPIDECTIYDEDEKDFITKTLSYDTENSLTEK